jgi:hypothetical protein
MGIVCVRFRPSWSATVVYVDLQRIPALSRAAQCAQITRVTRTERRSDHAATRSRIPRLDRRRTRR